MNLVLGVPQREVAEVIFAGHLLDLTKRARDRYFFDIGRDIPYLARILCDGMTGVGFGEGKPSYLMVWPAPSVKLELNKEDPVLVRAVADTVVLEIAMNYAQPSLSESLALVNGVCTLYRFSSEHHPDIGIRPALESMSNNFGAWANILPGFRREVSLLVS